MAYMESFLRWVHIITGILWIGMLYFFNFVNAYVATTYDADSKKKVVPQLMPRALYWFRFGALFTWVTGILLLATVFYHGGMIFEGEQTWHLGAFVMIALVFLAPFIYDAIFTKIKAKHPHGIAVAFLLIVAMILGFVFVGKLGYRAYVIHLGTMFGTIMAFNVWFRIWPAQRQIVTAIRDGVAPNADLVALAGLRSKHNTYMSMPLIWTMINSHTVVVGADSPFILIGVVAFGFWIAKHIYDRSAKVKGF